MVRIHGKLLIYSMIISILYILAYGQSRALPATYKIDKDIPPSDIIRLKQYVPDVMISGKIIKGFEVVKDIYFIRIDDVGFCNKNLCLTLIVDMRLGSIVRQTSFLADSVVYISDENQYIFPNSGHFHLNGQDRMISVLVSDKFIAIHM